MLSKCQPEITFTTLEASEIFPHAYVGYYAFYKVVGTVFFVSLHIILPKLAKPHAFA